MQLYGLDPEGKLIHARQAIRRTDYQCLECEQTVRLRGGPQRQPHFYHLDPTPFCRQHQKGAVHLQVQSYFLQHLPTGDCQLECSFPSIGRIADVAWHSQKMIFEIQCSPISAEEVLARNRDYQQMGWQVIWILHDQRYNQFRLSAAELALRSSPHFFTNMDHLGSGIIYDQFDICDRGLRLKRLSPLAIDICKPVLKQFTRDWKCCLKLAKERIASWNLFFSGDLITSIMQSPEEAYWDQAIEIEKLFYPSLKPFRWHQMPIRLWQRAVARPYQIFFRFLLERMCR